MTILCAALMVTILMHGRVALEDRAVYSVVGAVLIAMLAAVPPHSLGLDLVTAVVATGWLAMAAYDLSRVAGGRSR